MNTNHKQKGHIRRQVSPPVSRERAKFLYKLIHASNNTIRKNVIRQAKSEDIGIIGEILANFCHGNVRLKNNRLQSELLNKYRTKQKAIANVKRLDKSLFTASPNLFAYFMAFNFDSRHPVIRKLLKKVLLYIESQRPSRN